MKYIKMILINLFYSAIIGVLMQLIWTVCFNHMDQLTINKVMSMVYISMIIGTVCMCALFFVTLKMNDRNKATMVNVMITFILLVVVYVQTGIFYSIWMIDLKWLIILVVSESATTILTILWFNKIQLFRDKLAIKQASLKE